MPLTVLVLDDNAIVVKTLVMVLHHLGMAAAGFTSSGEAVREAGHYRPDVVLCEPEMPGSLDAARQIQRRKRDCRVILFSGSLPSDRALALAKQTGVNAEFLPKPIAPNELMDELLNPLRRVA